MVSTRHDMQITGINWRMTRWWRAFSVSHCFGLALVVFMNAIFFHFFFFFFQKGEEVLSGILQ